LLGLGGAATAATTLNRDTVGTTTAMAQNGDDNSTSFQPSTGVGILGESAILQPSEQDDDEMGLFSDLYSETPEPATWTSVGGQLGANTSDAVSAPDHDLEEATNNGENGANTSCDRNCDDEIDEVSHLLEEGELGEVMHGVGGSSGVVGSDGAHARQAQDEVENILPISEVEESQNRHSAPSQSRPDQLTGTTSSPDEDLEDNANAAQSSIASSRSPSSDAPSLARGRSTTFRRLFHRTIGRSFGSRGNAPP